MDQYIKANINTPTIALHFGDKGLGLHIKKLTAGRIDSVIESTAVMNAKLLLMGLSDRIVKAGTIGSPTLLYVVCSPVKPVSKTYVKLLSEGIRSMRKSGELDSILSRYGVTDWK